MQTYKIPLVPGPVSIPEEIRLVYGQDFGSSDMEDEFFKLYEECEHGLREILGTKNRVAILSGKACLPCGARLKERCRAWRSGAGRLYRSFWAWDWGDGAPGRCTRGDSRFWV